MIIQEESRSRHGHVDGVVAGGAVGVGWGFPGGLGLAVAVDGADLERVLAGAGVPVVDVLAPGVAVELGGETGFVPGFAAVGGDLDAPDAAVGGPGDAAYGDGAGLEFVAALDGVDAGLGFYGALLGPGALDPVGVEVPVGELYLREPLRRRNVAVDTRNDEAHRVAVLDGKLVAVKAEGDQGFAAVEGQLRFESGSPAVDAASDELFCAGAAAHVAGADAGLFENVGEENAGPTAVGDQATPHLVGDAREGHVGLAGGHGEQVIVAEFQRVAHRAANSKRPGGRVDAGRGEDGVYEVEVFGRRDQGRHPGHVYGGVGGGRRQGLVRGGRALRHLHAPGAGLLGPSAGERPAHARCHQTGRGGAPAEKQEVAASERHRAPRVRLAGPHVHGRRRIFHWFRGRPWPEARGAQEELGGGDAEAEGRQYGDDGGGGGERRLGEGGEDGDRGQRDHAHEGGYAGAQAEDRQQAGDCEGADDRRGDQDRNVRLPQRLDGTRGEAARREFYDPLRYRKEDGRHARVQPVRQLRHAERQDGPDGPRDERPDPCPTFGFHLAHSPKHAALPALRHHARSLLPDH